MVRPLLPLFVPLVFALSALSGCKHDCNPDNCADGCCDADGVCLVAGGDNACGLEAAECQDCSATGMVCSDKKTCKPRPPALGDPCTTHADCKTENESQPLQSYACFKGKCAYCGLLNESCVAGSCCTLKNSTDLTCDTVVGACRPR